MKTSTRIILAAAFVSTLGFSGLARTVYAGQSSSRVMLHQSSTRITSDGDGEQKDATEAPEQVKQPHSSISPSIPVQEASDGDGEENDATEAPEQMKKKSQAVTNSGSNTQEDINDAPNDADSTHEDAQ